MNKRLYYFAICMFALAFITCLEWQKEKEFNKAFSETVGKRVHLLDSANNETIAINDIAFVQYAKKIGLPQIEVSLILAKIESGNWSSPVFVRTNNMFGIKYFPAAKHMTTDSNSLGYVKYNHWTESLVGLKRYYELTGTHLSGYSETDGLSDRNWDRWLIYCHSFRCPFVLDSNHKIIFDTDDNPCVKK